MVHPDNDEMINDHHRLRFEYLTEMSQKDSSGEVKNTYWSHVDKKAQIDFRRQLEERIAKGEEMIYEEKTVVTVSYIRISWQTDTKI